MHSPQNEYSGVIVNLVRALAISERTGETTSAIADRLRMPAPAARILRAATAAGTLSDPQWAEQMADLAAASSIFMQQLGGRSAFASLLDLGVLSRAPLRSRVTAVAEAAIGEVTAEGRASPVSRMTLSGGALAPQKAEATVVLSREIIENSSASSQAFVSRQLRRAVAKALDIGFFDSLVNSGTPTFTATADHAADLKTMLDATNVGEGRLCWIASTSVGNAVCLLNDGRGRSAPEGISEFLNLPFCVSPGLAGGSLLLIDGDRVLGDIQSLGIDISRHAAIEMNDAPVGDADTPTPTSLVSLWQTDVVGVRLSALFGVTAGDPAALCIMQDITWGAAVSG